MHDHGLIQTEEALHAFLVALEGSPWIAVDTEFMREKTYFPQLCLVQIATPDHIACVDPLALSHLGPLTALLHDPAVLKVFHCASQDLEVLHQVTGAVPAPVFDTQVAASLLGYGEQVGYGNLVQAVLGLELDKTQTRTDWSRRPLRPEQLAYAHDDVRHLVALFLRLYAELETLGRLAWLQPEMETLTHPELYRPKPYDAWRRVGGYKRLKPRELAVLRELAAWREDEALRLNRPRRWIIGDDLLLLIARVRPGDPEALRALRGFPGSLGPEQCRQLLDAVRRGVDAPRETWPASSPRSGSLSESEEVVVDIAMALLRELSRRHRISAEAVGSRRDVIALMRGEEGAALARGWRRTVAGDEVGRWLAGQTAVRCMRDHVALTESIAVTERDQAGPPQ